MVSIIYEIITYNVLFITIGINQDYYIAVAITYEGMFEFPHKRFYWCLSNDFTFKETPDLNDQHRDFIDQDNTFFQGDPARKLKQTGEGEDGEGGAEPEAAAEEDGEEEGDDKSLKSD